MTKAKNHRLIPTDSLMREGTEAYDEACLRLKKKRRAKKQAAKRAKAKLRISAPRRRIGKNIDLAKVRPDHIAPWED